MRLVRFGNAGAGRPGVLDSQGQVRSLAGRVPDFAGDGVAFAALDVVRGIDPESLPVVEQPDLRCPLASTPNFYCIGLNYARHAAETGAEPPTEPILFSKASSSLSGPFDDILLPPGSEATDWEVELGVVIGTRVSHVSEAEALNCVAAYCTINDVSERDYQIRRGGQWIKGKSAPSFGPLGPQLVAADEVSDPQALDVWLKVNGETMQSSSTSDMIFGVAEIISYMSRFMTLVPGDVIATGTPEGVGMGRDPKVYLKSGDVVELEVADFGAQRQTVRSAA